jgi:radical SAM superfamily enzyme YgiQ (UPF0313 family)
MMLLIVCFACLAAVFGFTGFMLYMMFGRNRYGSKRGRHQRPKLTARPGAVAEGALKPEPIRTIRVYFIKPSHYDDEGYVSLYRYGVQPNNTLTVLAALNEAFNRRYAGERNLHLETIIWDEVCDGLISGETIAAIKEKAAEDGVELLVGFAGVQSNQYPRGRDLALQFVAQGVTTMMGGFHVSGYADSCKFLNSCGVTTVQGEAENLWAEIIEDFLKGQLKPHYSVTNGIRAKTGGADIMVPLIGDAQLPLVDDRYLTRFINPQMTTLDTSRGCPFTCSYCSVKNVMGRAMRSREPGAVVNWVREACRDHGITSLFLVDDDFFRSPRWEEILTGMAEVKKEFPRLSFMMQVDVDASCYANVAEGETETAKHRRAKRFTELSAAAGCYSAFVGIESLNPDNLNFASKYQNTDDRQHRFSLKEARARVIDKYRRVVENWHRVGVAVHAGYMLGFPFDGPDCGRIAAETLRKIGFDIVSFFLMTPLPGTEDQERLAREGKISDWDFNNLDSQHAAIKHDKLDNHDWMQVYRDAFTGFYSLRRTLREIFTVSGGRGLSLEARRSILRQSIYYFFSYRQGRHPMLGGIWQIRRRDVRRGAITDEEARRQYLGGLRFDAILRGDRDGLATA